MAEVKSKYKHKITLDKSPFDIHLGLTIFLTILVGTKGRDGNYAMNFVVGRPFLIIGYFPKFYFF